MVIIKWTISIAGSEFNHEQNRSIVLNFNTLYEYDYDSTVNSTLVQLNHASLTILESKTVLQNCTPKDYNWNNHGIIGLFRQINRSISVRV